MGNITFYILLSAISAGNMVLSAINILNNIVALRGVPDYFVLGHAVVSVIIFVFSFLMALHTIIKTRNY